MKKTLRFTKNYTKNTSGYIMLFTVYLNKQERVRKKYFLKQQKILHISHIAARALTGTIQSSTIDKVH